MIVSRFFGIKLHKKTGEKVSKMKEKTPFFEKNRHLV